MYVNINFVSYTTLTVVQKISTRSIDIRSLHTQICYLYRFIVKIPFRLMKIRRRLISPSTPTPTPTMTSQPSSHMLILASSYVTPALN